MNMDRRTVIGMVLLGVIIMGWSYFMTSKTNEENAQKVRVQDSLNRIAKIEQARKDSLDKIRKDSIAKLPVKVDTAGGKPVNRDSIAIAAKKALYGPFESSMKGSSEPIVIENELIKATIDPKGGAIATVQLKKYQTYSKQPLILFDADSSGYGLELTTAKTARNFYTDSLYFEPTGKSFVVNGKDSSSVSLRLFADSARTKYIEYVYGLKGNSYMPSFRINFVNMQEVIKDQIGLAWWMSTPKQEKNKKNEQQVSTTYYYFDNDDYDYINPAKEEEQKIAAGIKWLSFKQQFFSSILVADKKFNSGATVSSFNSADPRYVKRFKAVLPVPFGRSANETMGMRFYFGTNDYQDLKAVPDLKLESQINLGFFGFLNKWAIIPLFSALTSSGLNIGLVILLITLVVKVVLFPIAYKSFLSSAKMRVLKPEMDEINERYKDGDPMQKQQATMAIYKKAGVNPMAGCIPLLLQIPILFALIAFFPAAFELRQKGFLWAEDLSTYDSIINLGFSIPGYGDHVSLFALLMTISTIIYTWMNQQMMPANNQFPAMKYMMYIMPVFFLIFLNSYSAGLSYYYFLSNMITFAQMWLIRKYLIDDKKLRAQIEENKKKPVKKSAFMERLEKAQKARTEQLREGQNKNGKGKKK